MHGSRYWGPCQKNGVTTIIPARMIIFVSVIVCSIFDTQRQFPFSMREQ